eukprot:10930538-Alexandrium_andersonii.AAC.1
MSASLVGSEMCIRDRRLSVSTAVDETREAPGGDARRGRDPRRGGRVSPVSYTHLTLPTICSV